MIRQTGGMKARDSDMRGRPGSGGYIRGGGRGGGGTGGSLPRYGSQGSQGECQWTCLVFKSRLVLNVL